MSVVYCLTALGERGSMAGLHDILKVHVDNGSVPGAVGLVARGGRMEVAAVGSMAVGGAPMARDSIFRFASVTKPITAAAVMMLVDDGLIALDDPVGRWLPELAEPKVVRTPASPVEDVVAGTVAILLTQVAADSPFPQKWMPDFWRYATNARG